MRIIVGSKNPAKINAVKAVYEDAEVLGLDVPSNVSPQPLSDIETMEGAINRASECAKFQTDVIGIGLEGGVMEIANRFFVCNWGALVDQKGNVFTASGARIPLPEEIAIELKKGKELGDVMDEYTQKQGIRKKEGAIGVFTNQEINRVMMFSHVVSMLKGLYEFSTLPKADE